MWPLNYFVEYSSATGFPFRGTVSSGKHISISRLSLVTGIIFGNEGVSPTRPHQTKKALSGIYERKLLSAHRIIELSPDCRFRGRRFESQIGHIILVEIDHEILLR